MTWTGPPHLGCQGLEKLGAAVETVLNQYNCRWDGLFEKVRLQSYPAPLKARIISISQEGEREAAVRGDVDDGRTSIGCTIEQ